MCAFARKRVARVRNADVGAGDDRQGPREPCVGRVGYAASCLGGSARHERGQRPPNTRADGACATLMQ